jgi:hypothetical protein
MYTEEDITEEVEKAAALWKQIVGEDPSQKDLKRLRVDVLLRLGNPVLWTEELGKQLIKDKTEEHERLMKWHHNVDFETHPHADLDSKEHKAMARPPRAASVEVTDVPIGTSVEPKK